MVGRIRSTSVGSLLPQLGLGNGLRNRVVVAAPRACCEDSVVSRSEELLRGHHHLLVGAVRVRSLPLVHQIEQVGLVRRLLSVTNSTRRSDPIVPHSSAVRLRLVLVLPESTVVPLRVLVDRVAVVVLRREALILVMASIALTQLRHEISVEHGLSHLLLIALARAGSVVGSKAASSSLVELVLASSIGSDIRKHVVDPGVVGRLEHDASLGRIHFIDAQRPPVVASLLPHSIRHEESLVRLATQHALVSLGGRLGLGSSEVGLSVHSHQGILSKRVVGHGVFIHLIGLEIRHHVGKASLGRGFGSLLGALAVGAHLHLLEVFLGSWIQLRVEVVLRLHLLGL